MKNFHNFNDLCNDGVIIHDKLHLVYISNFLTSKDTSNYYKIFQNTILWKNDKLNIMGKNLKVRRKVALYGGKNIAYKYSGSKKKAIPWTKSLNTIKKQIEQISSHEFNSVLLNYYEDGEVYMGWHSDNEIELGANPVIASLSLGESRDFLFKHKYNKNQKKIKINLKSGSLLIMKGETQYFWNHCLPKRRGIHNGRINLTFRYITH